MIEHKNIHEAINAVMSEVGYVRKQKSDQLKYTYLGEQGDWFKISFEGKEGWVSKDYSRKL